MDPSDRLLVELVSLALFEVTESVESIETGRVNDAHARMRELRTFLEQVKGKLNEAIDAESLSGAFLSDAHRPRLRPVED